MYKNEQLYALWMIDRAWHHRATLYKTVSKFNSAEEVYFCSKNGFGPEFTGFETELFADKNLESAQRRLDYCNRHGIRVLPFGERDYPLKLRNIDKHPCALFIKGTFPAFDDIPTVGIVGTRDACEHSRKVAAAFSYELSSAGVLVVSGMAKGIDTAAHKGALLCEHPTVAVFAGSVERVYPSENQELYERIIANGAVVSEYAPGIEVRSYMFVERNRIISGLSDSVVVVESDLKGGSMTTAAHALKQKRTLFAVPGPLYTKEFAGSNSLFCKGALPAVFSDDILRHLDEKYDYPKVKRRSKLTPAYLYDSHAVLETENPGANDTSVENLYLDKEKESPKVKEKKEPVTFKPEVTPVPKPKKTEIKKSYVEIIKELDDVTSDDERNVLGYLVRHGEASTDELCGKLDMDFSQAITALGMLELNGYCYGNGGSVFKLSAEKAELFGTDK